MCGRIKITEPSINGNSRLPRNDHVAAEKISTTRKAKQKNIASDGIRLDGPPAASSSKPLPTKKVKSIVPTSLFSRRIPNDPQLHKIRGAQNPTPSSVVNEPGPAVDTRKTETARNQDSLSPPESWLCIQEFIELADPRPPRCDAAGGETVDLRYPAGKRSAGALSRTTIRRIEELQG